MLYTGRIITHTFLLIVTGGFAYFAAGSAFDNFRNGREINGPFDPFSMEVYEFIKTETPANSVIIFFKPRAMRLFTDRNSLALTECDRMPEGDYLVLNKKVGENLQIPPERIDDCNLLLEQVFENRRFVVYRVLK